MSIITVKEKTRVRFWLYIVVEILAAIAFALFLIYH